MSSVDGSQDHPYQPPQHSEQPSGHGFEGTHSAVEEVGWYILGENQQHLGPYASSELREHFLNGYLSESTLVWSEGRVVWQPLSSIPELISGISQQKADSSIAARTNSDNELEKSDDVEETERGNVGFKNESHSTDKEQAKDSSSVPFSDDDAEFEKWQREVRDAEAEAQQLKNGSDSGSIGAGVGLDDYDRAMSPPEGEEEFTDDDGTTYKWDRGLRAWVPQDDTSSMGGQYGLDEMTFLQEEEVFPTVNIEDAASKEKFNGTSDTLEPKHNGKRKLMDMQTDNNEKQPDKKEKQADNKEANKAPDSWFELKVNTHIYVTGLPDDVTAEEVTHNTILSYSIIVFLARNSHVEIYLGGRGIFQVWDYQRGRVAILFKFMVEGPNFSFAYDAEFP